MKTKNETNKQKEKIHKETPKMICKLNYGRFSLRRVKEEKKPKINPPPMFGTRTDNFGLVAKEKNSLQKNETKTTSNDLTSK